MLILGVLLALSLVTIIAVLMSCEVQARALRETGSVVTLPAGEREAFDRIVAQLAADPDFGRIDGRH
jgi:hypothetical protein